MATYFLNSLIITIPTTIITLIISSMSGFTLAIHKFKFNMFIFAMFIAGSGLIDTEVIWNFALITVAASTLPNLLGMFLLRKEMKFLLKDYLK